MGDSKSHKDKRTRRRVGDAREAAMCFVGETGRRHDPGREAQGSRCDGHTGMAAFANTTLWDCSRQVRSAPNLC
jgi:hypothetical protein